MKLTRLALAFALATSFAASSFAQTPAAAPAAGKPTAAAAAKPAVQHSAKSIECSKQADAKGLHGKERKTFRDACKKA